MSNIFYIGGDTMKKENNSDVNDKIEKIDIDELGEEISGGSLKDVHVRPPQPKDS
ncbi:MAG: hypothetical protein IJ583_05170 [Firmicutes bacterium]|nr:hypothetical protein [Bacillota bacterium]